MQGSGGQEEGEKGLLPEDASCRPTTHKLLYIDHNGMTCNIQCVPDLSVTKWLA